eukprot:TRINITY_DN660_c0_g1_i4.p1 TRINITY_DN660_c0_g1~~TRINITY_DN660_c0_g1_i4.p1  ORF type:complete len:414 (-),score=39.90 TRINITY_DN660_c0_g1_i4:136-1377(-)
MKNGLQLCFVLALFIAALSAQLAPSQITRFIIIDSWYDTIYGITHDLKSSPSVYDTSANAEDDVIPAGRILEQLAPYNFFSNEFTTSPSLSFDYDTENKVVYFGSTGLWLLYKINVDGSGLEAIFSSEYIFIKNLNIDFDSNYAYFTAYSLAYVNRTAIITNDFFSSVLLPVDKLAYVVVKANLLTGETEELFYSITFPALVFNPNYQLMFLFLVSFDEIFVMTVDKTVVDVIPLPSINFKISSTVLYDREEDVIYVVDTSIFYLKYEAQQSGLITVTSTISNGYAWHDTENNAFYFLSTGSGAKVSYFRYEDFESLISKSTYTTTTMFQITQSNYGLFAIACDGTSVSNCGWNTSSLPTYLVILIVLMIILPCLGCAGFIAAACNRKELKFPVDPWANMPLNQDPENAAPEQ